MDSAAYDEPVYEWQPTGTRCKSCGVIFESEAEWSAHSDAMMDQDDWSHGAYEVVFENVQVDTIHHDEVGHWEDQLVKLAYDETVVTGYKCSGCGATK